MAEECASPASSHPVLLPLNGRRSRRGSLASISSRIHVDKELLTQTLDQIHDSASRSDALTLFDDFDGGRQSRSGSAKEIVSGGISGLYSRLRQSVGGVAGSSKDAPRKANDRNKAPSTHNGGRAVHSESATRLVEDIQTSDRNSKPLPGRDESEHLIPLVDTKKSHQKLQSIDETNSNGHGLQETSSIAWSDRNSVLSQTSRDHTAPLSLSKAEQAGTRPSTRVASDQPGSEQDDEDIVGDVTRYKRSNLLKEQLPEARYEMRPTADEEYSSTEDEGIVLPPETRSGSRVAAFDVAHPAALSTPLLSPGQTPDIQKSQFSIDLAQPTVSKPSLEPVDFNTYRAEVDSERLTKPEVIAAEAANQQRPPMVHVGPSHLPGFKLSRTSSTDGGDQVPINTRLRIPMLKNNDSKSSVRVAGTAIAPLPSGLKPQTPGVITSSLRRRVISQKFWMKDENARDCFYCGDSFSTFRRKHHCRVCGNIFDAKCTVLVSGKPFGQPGSLRLCKSCESMVYGDDDESTVASDDEGHVPSPHLRRPLEPSRTTSNLQYDERPTNDDGILATPSIGIPVSRRTRDAKRRSAVLEFDSHPMLARPSSSRSLKSLSGRRRSSSHRRNYSHHYSSRAFKDSDGRAPFHQGVNVYDSKPNQLPAFHNDNIIDPDLAPFLSDEDSGEDEQASIFATLNAEAPGTSSADGERPSLAGLLASAVRKGRSRLGEKNAGGSQVREADAVSLASKSFPRLARKRNFSIGSDVYPQLSPRRSRSNNLLKSFNARCTGEETGEAPQQADTIGDTNNDPFVITPSSAMHGDGAPFVDLNPASLQHLRRLLKQVLKDVGISSARTWKSALLPVVLRCGSDVDPDVQRGDNIDIRDYLKLKRIPGGRPSDTTYVTGVVFSKNLALKSMPRTLLRPRIMLITFAIEYARYHQHFMSLEPVIAQEREYLRNLVARIASLQPTLVLVRRNVAGLAMQFLDEAGIAVAQNVKPSVLAAVARCTQTRLITSVDKLSLDPAHLGTCDKFEAKTFQYNGTKKTYLYLSGCPPRLGCTIVLRGADRNVLQRVKRIMEFMSFVVYNLKLETSLMDDESIVVPEKSEAEMFSSQPQPPNSDSSLLNCPSVAVSRKIQERNAHSLSVNDAADVADPAAVDPPTAKEGDTTEATNPVTQSEGLSKILSLDGASVPDDEPMPSQYSDMVEAHKTKIISASPFVRFTPPYLLMQTREQERRVVYFKRLKYQYKSIDPESDEEKQSSVVQAFELVKPEMVHVALSQHQSRAVRDYLHAVHSAQYDKAVHAYETQKRLWELFIASNANPFDPWKHQSITVLYTLMLSKTTTPCNQLEQLTIHYYICDPHTAPGCVEDMTLGQYVEDLCESGKKECPNCREKMLDHHRQYYHGSGRLSVAVQSFPSNKRKLQHSISMWAVCRICQAETPPTRMSENTWRYSFGKYLELSFWCAPLYPREDVCKHDINRDFWRYFGYKDVAIRVQYDPIEIYELVIPRTTITWRVEKDLSLKNQQYELLKSRLGAFIASVKARLQTINLSTVAADKASDASVMVEKLMQQATDDYNALLEKLQAKYMGSRYYEVIPFNRALRYMEEKAIAWDEIFADFERNYFPSETDIRKLATLQLKKLFLDRSQNSAGSVGTETPDDIEMAEKASSHDSLSFSAAELDPEEARNVLDSVVDEHRACERQDGVEQGPESKEFDSQTVPNAGQVTIGGLPVEESPAHVVDREDVKHLDLAIPTRSANGALAELSDSSHTSGSTTRPTTSDSQVRHETFAIEPKPLTTGILERIEQMRSAASGASMTETTTESRIPRLADLQKRVGGTAAPHLTRAQSQPAGVPQCLSVGDGGNTGGQLLPSPEPVADTPATLSAVARDVHSNVNRLTSDRPSVGVLPPPRVSKPAASLIPRSIPNSTIQAYQNTRVSALAKHFDQLSLEFEKHRLRERQLRAARSRQARANPLASSTPVVEVYEDARQAVGLEEQKGASRVEKTKDGVEGADKVDTRQPLQTRAHSADFKLGTGREGSVEADTKSAAPPESHQAADNEAEGDTDTEPGSGRHREISDPVSGTTSSAPMSPTLTGDIDLHVDLSLPKHEKTSLMKMLTTFWSERSASGWHPLDYPLLPTEHVFDDSDIIVREDEPSS
ncbi:Mitochondrial distribution and morphology protein 12, partial [Elasticomyces elasticus]